MEKKQYSNPRTSNQLFKLDAFQVCIICDRFLEKHEIGTGFLFLRNDWIVTAAHVVIEKGVSRKGLYGVFPAKENNIVILEVLAVHKENDIAILQILGGETNNPCKRPLFPGYDDLSVSRGLISCGFYPTKGINLSLVHVYEKDFRYRTETETILEFETDQVVGGSSGGPIFGDGGVVLGILINIFQNSEDPTKTLARATSIQNLMNCIEIKIDQEKFISENTENTEEQ